MKAHYRERIAATTLLFATLALLACGGGENPIEPSDDGDDNPPPPPPPPALDYEGYAVYAVDLNNRLLLFGSESPTTISKMIGIKGVPILNRIVGIDFRPSTGELYGVGNDSRVYTIDPETGETSPVGPEFTPTIASFFDIHFGMAFDPATEQIRLIARESGANWLIDPDDGTAVGQESVHFAEGDPNEGIQPKLAGLAYTPPSAGATNASSLHAAVASVAGPFCPDLDGEDLVWSFATLLESIVGSCDPGNGEFITIALLEGINAVLGCAEVNFDPEGNLFGTLLWQAKEGEELLNSLFEIHPETGSPAGSGALAVQAEWIGDLPVDSPIQAIAVDPNAEFHPPSQTTSSSVPLSVAVTGDLLRTSGTGLEACAESSQ